MIPIPDSVIEKWIQEDAPSLDLTTHLLGIGGRPGALIYRARTPLVVCGTEEVARIGDRLGLRRLAAAPSGSRAAPGDVIASFEGSAAALHLVWKVGVNLLEHSSGIATRTARLVEAARKARDSVRVVVTRKNIPGTKEIAIKAAVAGGALPHRLGLSETVLVFEQHRVFFPSFGAFASQIRAFKCECPEKKFIVEVTTEEEALQAAAGGADGLQFDKVNPDLLRPWVAKLRGDLPPLIMIAAGGINEANAPDYVATGVDTLATSWIYSGPPADIGASIEPR